LRPISDPKGIEPSSLTIALTGDGRWESSYILPALASRFDGTDKALLVPSVSPYIIRRRQTNTRVTGFSVLRSIKILTSNYGVNRFLVVIDIEHSNGNRLIDQIKRKLAEYGFSEVRPTLLDGDAISVQCKHGSRDICIKAAFSGQNRCIEENIADLINLELGIPVQPDKGSIRNVLKQRDLDLKQLLERATIDNLSRAFRALCVALRSLEASYGQ
jgi:hypothetical protein